MTKETLFTIYDLDIKSDTVYQVTPKLDFDAPQAFQDFGTTKVLSTDVDNDVPGAIFDTDKNAWDTGMYLESRALNKAFPDEKERKAALKNIEKYIVVPIEKIKGAGALSHLTTNNKFWDDFRIKIKKDAVFFTNKTEELLALFLAVLHRQVSPSTIATGNHEFAKAQYSIQDKDSVVDRQQQLEMAEMEANGIFYQMLKTKRSDLISMLDYLDISVSQNSEDPALISLFKRFTKHKEDGLQNIKSFLKLAEKVSDEEGETEIYLFSKLKQLNAKGKVKQRKGEVFFEDELIGSNFKTAAAFVMQDKELQKRILEL